MTPIEIILIAILFAGTIGTMWYMFWHIVKDINRHEDLIIKLAKKLAETKDQLADIDQSTGLELNRLTLLVNTYKEELGEAAEDAHKETARAQKAWADGVNAIMSYGPDLYGRGERE